MSFLRKYFESQVLRRTDNYPFSILFIKLLYSYLLFKIIISWPVIRELQYYYPFEYNSIWSYTFYLPLGLSRISFDGFILVCILIVLFGLIYRSNYFTSLLVFWIACWFFRLELRISTGADLVLNLFLFLSIFLPVYPLVKSVVWREYQLIISNTAFLMIKIQLVMIYLLSGVDKLFSSSWRDGSAMYSILNLEFYTRYFLMGNLNEVLSLILAWLTILFELSFPVFIWFEKFRKTFLIFGLLFHAVIIFLLTIPDFGIVMLIGYVPFCAKWKASDDYENKLILS